MLYSCKSIMSHQVHGVALIPVDSITAQLQKCGYAVIPDMARIDEIGKIERFIDDGVSGGAGTRRLIGRPWCSRLDLHGR